MSGGDRLRLFCALRLPGEVCRLVATWQREHLSRGRVVALADLHVTLAFLGWMRTEDVAAVGAALAAAAAEAGPIAFRVQGYRETRSVGMLVFDDVGRSGADLAEGLAVRLEQRGLYQPEPRPWLPHVTVLRFRERPRLRPPLPALPEVSPSDAAVYSSVLRSSGAQYEVLETFVLGGR